MKKTTYVGILLFVICSIFLTTNLVFADNKNLDLTIEYSYKTNEIDINSKSEFDAKVYVALFDNENQIGEKEIFTKLVLGENIISVASMDTQNSDKIKIYLKNLSDETYSVKEYETNIDTSNIIRVENSNLTDKDGNTIILKGTNFGGWLINETWMCPVFQNNQIYAGEDNDIALDWANLDTIDMLEEKYGTKTAMELIEKYQDNYITEQDFKNVADMGFNSIRIPFWYRNFLSDENGTYYTENDNENPGFKRLDWVVDMAEKYNLYLIFDMHGCPGGQNGDHASGKTGRGYLYSSENYQQIMEDLWVKIASRYKNCPQIIAYDIMNEPMCNSDAAHGVLEEYCYGAGSLEANNEINKIYDRMIKAIRKVDTKHTITVEGIWTSSCLPDPKEFGWENMLYQIHIYTNSKDDVDSLAKHLAEKKDLYGVAVYVGEFNPNAYAKESAEIFNKYNISWNAWNYKTAKLKGTPKDWGLYYKNYNFFDLTKIMFSSGISPMKMIKFNKTQDFNVLSDDEILSLYQTLWSKEYLSTDKFKQNTKYLEMLK